MICGVQIIKPAMSSNLKYCLRHQLFSIYFVVEKVKINVFYFQEINSMKIQNNGLNLQFLPSCTIHPVSSIVSLGHSVLFHSVNILPLRFWLLLYYRVTTQRNPWNKQIYDYTGVITAHTQTSLLINRISLAAFVVILLIVLRYLATNTSEGGFWLLVEKIGTPIVD